MGLKQSTAAPTRLGGGYVDAVGGSSRTFSSSTPPATRRTVLSGGGQASRTSRALSVGNFLPTSVDVDSANLSTSASSATFNATPIDSSEDDYSTDDGDEMFGATQSSASLPAQLSFYRDLKCPVCRKNIPSDDVEVHLLLCLTKPQIVYNDDVLMEDKGECSICLDDLRQGDTIARLPCLCIYHKGCIDEWFAVNRCCPEHPGD